MSGSFVVMNDRLIEVYRAKLAADAYAMRTRLAREYKCTFTVAYLPSDFSIGSQTLLGVDGATVKYVRNKRA